LLGHERENIAIRTPLVLVIRSYSDKTFTVMNIAVWMLLSHSYM